MAKCLPRELMFAVLVLPALLFWSVPETDAGIIWDLVGSPSPKAASGGEIVTNLKFSSSDARTGAYHLRLKYNRTLLKIVSITVPTTSEFSGNTFFNSKSFASGTTDITAFQTKKSADQKTTKTFAQIRWKVLGPAGTTAKIRIIAKGMVDAVWRPIEVNSYGVSFKIGKPLAGYLQTNELNDFNGDENPEEAY